MKYMLLMYANEAAGILLSNSGLAPVVDATTARIRNGKTLTTDGPFAATINR